MEKYSIEPVTSTDDLHAIAIVFMTATQHTDTFWEMKTRYGPVPPFEELLNILRESIENPNHHVFKAVDRSTGEVVGMAQWKAPWYVDVAKVDPFAKVQLELARDAHVAPLAPIEQKPEDPAKAAGIAMLNESSRQIGNTYITYVRGKKHVCELRCD